MREASSYAENRKRFSVEIPVSFMVERLQKLPCKAFVIEDGSKVYAAHKGKLVIFTGQPGEFNRMTEHQLNTFIRKNADKQGTPVEEKAPVYQDGDWFVDETGEEHRTWELQYNIDENYSEWVALVHPAANPPKGRRVEMPERSEWDPEHFEKHKTITPSQAADYILNDNNWGPGEDETDGEQPSNSDS